MTSARRIAPSGLVIVCEDVPDTTCALVTTYPSPTGNPLPVTMPPHPTLETLTTTAAACFTPAVSIDAGTGRAPGSPLGSRPANTGGNCTPARTCATLARNPG